MHKIVERKSDFILGSILYFSGNESTLSPEQKQIVIAWAQDLCDLKGEQIEVRGHIEDVEGRAAKKTPLPWQTTYARCLEVRDFLVKLGIKSDRIQIAVSSTPPTEDTHADRAIVSLWREPERVAFKGNYRTRKQ